MHKGIYHLTMAWLYLKAWQWFGISKAWGYGLGHTLKAEKYIK